MIGLAVRPGIEVEPTCSSTSAAVAQRGADLRRLARVLRGQVGIVGREVDLRVERRDRSADADRRHLLVGLGLLGHRRGPPARLTSAPSQSRRRESSVPCSSTGACVNVRPLGRPGRVDGGQVGRREAELHAAGRIGLGGWMQRRESWSRCRTRSRMASRTSASGRRCRGRRRPPCPCPPRTGWRARAWLACLASPYGNRRIARLGAVHEPAELQMGEDR